MCKKHKILLAIRQENTHHELMNDEITPQSIKEWLANARKDREWLADQLGISKRTIDNYLTAGQKIPLKRAYKMQALFAPEPIFPQDPKNIILSIPITRGTLIQLESQALQQCTTLSSLVSTILEQAINPCSPPSHNLIPSKKTAI